MTDPVWLVGGLDPTGGAGVLRDFATARAVAPALPVRVIVTAWTRQGTGQPAQAQVAEGFDYVWDGQPTPAAVKVGLVAVEALGTVEAQVGGVDAPIVFDPVLVASDGGRIGPIPERLESLLELATLVTPNRSEAGALAGHGDPQVVLPARFPRTHFLFKDALAHPDRVVDHLVGPTHDVVLERPRRPGPDPRGTGCALSTAVACRLARGDVLPDAVSRAVAWLDDARTRPVDVGGQWFLR